MKEIRFPLYDNDNALEASLLRGILLYNQMENHPSRKQIIPRAVFSIVVEGNGSFSNDMILNLFHKRFKYSMSPDELSTIINNLKANGHLNKDGQPVRPEDYYDALDLETSNLFDRIIQRVELRLHSGISDKEHVRENIRRAFSVYFKLFGYAFFDLQESSWDEGAHNAVLRAIDNLSVREGEALIQVLSETIARPSEEDKHILEQWARAFVMMEMISLDPSLRDFKAEKLRNKEFILDTDFVLRCLTTEVEHSKEYRKVIQHLRQIGCKLYLPKQVFNEIIGHATEALSIFYRYGDGVETFPSEVFRNGIRNVFLEDFVTVRQSDTRKNDMHFNQYIGNIYNSQRPELLKAVLRSLLGDGIFNNCLPEDVDPQQLAILSKKILEYTNTAFKADQRTEQRKNEISETDAFLYLVAVKRNEHTSGNSFLSKKTYLLTRSTRANKAAKDTGQFHSFIVCHPNALISILKETGNVGDSEISIINLFDNPFLAHTAHEMWSVLEPVVQDAKLFKYSSIEKLRSDVDFLIDAKMTARSTDADYVTKTKKLQDKLGIITYEKYELLEKELAQTKTLLKKKECEYDNLQLDYKRQNNELVRIKSGRGKSGDKTKESHRSKKKAKK